MTTNALRDDIRLLFNHFASTPGAADKARPPDRTQDASRLATMIPSLPLWRETADLVFIAFGLWSDLAPDTLPTPSELRIAVARAAAAVRRWDRVRELLAPLVALPGAATAAETTADAIARIADLHLGHLQASSPLAALTAPAFPPERPTADPRFIPADLAARHALMLTHLVAGNFGAADALAANIAEQTPAATPDHTHATLTRAHIAWREGRFGDAATHADRVCATLPTVASWEAACAALLSAIARFAAGSLVAPSLADHLPRLAHAGPSDLGSCLAMGLPVEPLAGPLRAGCRPLADALAAAITERAIAVDAPGIVFAALGAARLHLAHGATAPAIAALEAGLDALVAIPGNAGGRWYDGLKQARRLADTVADATMALGLGIVSTPPLAPRPAVHASLNAARPSRLGPTGDSPLPHIHALPPATGPIKAILEHLDPAFTAPDIVSIATDSGAPTPLTNATQAPAIEPDLFVAADYLWDYRCNGKGCCCGGWNAGLTEADLHRLTTLTAGTELESVLERELFPSTPKPFAVFLPNRTNRPAAHTTQVRRLNFIDAGRCAFLENDQSCTIHATFGESGLADVCQIFPIMTRISDLGLSGSWDPLCPEVARLLAARTTPARLVARPATFTRAIRADADRPPEARRVAVRDLSIERYQFQQFRHAVAAAFAAVPDRPLAIIAAAVDCLKQWELQQVAPPLDDAAAAHLVDRARNIPESLGHVIDTLAAHLASPFDPLSDISGQLALARQFFVHHPWGTALTLDAVADAIDPHWGRLGWPTLALHWLVQHGSDDHLTLTNHLIAAISGPEPAHGSLLVELGSLVVRIGDALAVRGAMGDSDDPDISRGIFAAAIALSELLNRKDHKHRVALAETLLTRLDGPPTDTTGCGGLADVVAPLARLQRNSP